MNKTAIKKYAIWARNELITRVAQRALKYGIEDGKSVDKNLTSFHDYVFSDIENSQRKKLCQKIEEQGYQNTIEEIAYTWFNRFCAIRFMEVNGYLPSHVRVLSDDDDRFNPQIIGESINLDFVDLEYVYKLRENNKNEELYRYLLIMQCNELSKILPKMFEKIGGWAELLFPNNLLRTDSVIARMVEDIPEEDWTEQVQIIGWLYQYYNTEPKDKVFADLKKNIKVSAETIPAATQLFTPDWIVRYMVENSLGRLWVDGHSDFEKSDWKYYLEEAKQEEQVKAELDKLREQAKTIKPEEITFLDPCMGSGHVLVYAFDVFMQIYTSAGWSERDAALSILQNNLYGLDIDKRAFQLAYFAVMMKARQYNRRILTSGVEPNMAHFQEISNASVNTDFLSDSLKNFVNQFQYADTYGSLMTITATDGIDDELSEFIGTLDFDSEKLEQMMYIYRILSQKYDVVVTNPPYMGGSGMNTVLSEFVKNNFKDYKSDLFSAFVVRCTELTKKDGYLGFLTPYVWMFIQSYEKMRKYIYSGKTIETLIQFEYSAFEEATVPICTFVLKNSHVNKNGCYLRLTDFKGGMEVQRQKTLEAIENHKCGFYFEANSESFSKIPSSPVAYWVSEDFVRAFENQRLGEIASPRQGLATTNNEKYLRYWYEIFYNGIGFDFTCKEEASLSGKKWFPYNKGGNFRKWYGNNDYIVNYQDDGKEIKKDVLEKYPYLKTPDFVVKNTQFYFNESFSWSLISSSTVSFRYKPFGHIFDVAGMSCFTDENLYYLLALCNTNIVSEMLSVIAPTINYQCGDIAKIPVLVDENKTKIIEKITLENIDLSKTDWDSFETSWDFEGHSLV